jgi:hypothetical protein
MTLMVVPSKNACLVIAPGQSSKHTTTARDTGMLVQYNASMWNDVNGSAFVQILTHRENHMLRKFALPVLFIVVFAAGFVAGNTSTLDLLPKASAQNTGRVFEMRTYIASGGKLEELKARFRNHTMRYFEKHGMTNIGYWTPMDAPGSQTTIVYLLAHASRDAAKQSWAAFSKDPGWVEARTASNVNGNIVAKVESLFLDATDFSQLK